MPKKRVLHPQSIWNIEAVTNSFNQVGAKQSHIIRMYKYLLEHPESTWHDVPDLPKAAKAALDANFTMFTSTVIRQQPSSDGEAIKLLVQLQDGLQVESVIMSYDTTATLIESDQSKPSSDGAVASSPTQPPPKTVIGTQRYTLCVSSQVGCQMQCTFCATGTMGLTGDLSTGEICEQLVLALRVVPIRNVVFMGMGEPLNNYNAVKHAVLMMSHPQIFALRRRRITVSTVGIIPRITAMIDDMPGVSLALSLHAPNQELRTRIVPSGKAYKLEKLMAAVAAYHRATQQRILIEYVLLGEINTLECHARELGALLKEHGLHDCMVNLIPWNPILSPTIPFEGPTPRMIDAFQNVLKTEFFLGTTVRQEKGQDVAAACGQLALVAVEEAKAGAGAGGQVTDVEDLIPQLVRKVSLQQVTAV